MGARLEHYGSFLRYPCALGVLGAPHGSPSWRTGATAGDTPYRADRGGWGSETARRAPGAIGPRCAVPAELAGIARVVVPLRASGRLRIRDTNSVPTTARLPRYSASAHQVRVSLPVPIPWTVTSP